MIRRSCEAIVGGVALVLMVFARSGPKGVFELGRSLVSRKPKAGSPPPSTEWMRARFRRELIDQGYPADVVDELLDYAIQVGAEMRAERERGA